MSVERMAELRRQLAQVTCDAREAADHYANCVVVAHQALLVSKGNDIKMVGSSEDARKLAFAAAVLESVECGKAISAQRGLEYHAALYAAELEALKDARKERELDLLERQILAAV